DQTSNAGRIRTSIIRRILGLFFLFSLVLLAIVLLGNYIRVSGSNEQVPEFLPGEEIGTLEKEKITEASGMASSRKNRGILWVHNDSGDSANIYAIKSDGELIETFRIKKADSRDWEDIAIGPGPEKEVDYLYIGDIGDNSADYSSITVYRIEEPNLETSRDDTKIGPADEIKLEYPDGPKDAETLLVDPLNGDIYIITKNRSFGMVYLASFPQDTDKKTRLEFVTTIPLAMATGGDISPDGELVIVRALNSAGLWKRPADEKLWKAFSAEPVWLDLIDEPQGEAICFDAEGNGFYTLSEMKHAEIYYFGLSSAPEKQSP
ncbi:hypothetical protein ACFLZ8_05850, partial [Planctomycetota bacterium]